MKNFELKDKETYVIYYVGNKDFSNIHTTRQFALIKLNWTPETANSLTFLGHFYLTFMYEKMSKNDVLDYIDRLVGSIITKNSFEDWIKTFKEDGIDIIGI